MSRTYELACHDCKETLWVGQRPNGESFERAYIYSTEKHIPLLSKFLYSHVNHRLEFGDSEPMSMLDYVSVDGVLDLHQEKQSASDISSQTDVSVEKVEGIIKRYG